jgi:hypothetical protein
MTIAKPCCDFAFGHLRNKELKAGLIPGDDADVRGVAFVTRTPMGELIEGKFND